MSGSDTLRKDVIEMIIANADVLDRDYLDHWADELGITGALHQCLAEAEADR
jgi:hypothetical protein